MSAPTKKEEQSIAKSAAQANVNVPTSDVRTWTPTPSTALERQAANIDAANQANTAPATRRSNRTTQGQNTRDEGGRRKKRTRRHRKHSKKSRRHYKRSK